MKSMKTHSTLRTVLLFVLAASLLAVGGIGTARAVPAVQSSEFFERAELRHIGVSLLENGSAVSGELLGSLVPKGQEFHMGQAYKEALSVKNIGSIDEFVRVSIYRYWEDKDGAKLTTLDPAMIDLHLPTGSGWVIDEAASSTERIVLYYTSVLPTGETSAPFSDTLTINGRLPYKVEQSTDDSGVITTTYVYDDVTFRVDVQADAVQTHNAEAAVKSAWGRTVKVSGESLSLG